MSRSARSAWLATIASSSASRLPIAACSSTRRSRLMPAVRSGSPSATRSESGTTGGPAASPSGSSRVRTTTGSTSLRQTSACGRVAPGLGDELLQIGDDVDGWNAGGGQRSANGLRQIAIAADKQDAGGGEIVVIHPRHDAEHDNRSSSRQGRCRLLHRGADRARRDGPGLPGQAHQPAPARGDQDHRARAGREPEVPRALQPRGAHRRRAASPEHRDGLRRGRAGRPALYRDAVHRRLRPRQRAERAGPAAPLPRARRLLPGRRRTRHGPRARPDPPRRQARQRADRGAHRVPDRLRPDQAVRSARRWS